MRCPPAVPSAKSDANGVPSTSQNLPISRNFLRWCQPKSIRTALRDLPEAVWGSTILDDLSAVLSKRYRSTHRRMEALTSIGLPSQVGPAAQSGRCRRDALRGRIQRCKSQSPSDRSSIIWA